MKVIFFTGTRDLTKEETVRVVEELIDCKTTSQPDLVIVGDCPTGVDPLVATAFRPQVAKFTANWKKYKKAAGPIRNADMVKAAKLLGCTNGVAFLKLNSKGTLDCLKKAVAADITVHCIRP